MHVQWIIGGCKTTSTYATKRCLRVYQVETRSIWALASSDDPEPSTFPVVGTGLAAAVHRKLENNEFLFVLFRFFGIGCNKNHKWTILYTIQGLHRWYIHEDLERASLELYVAPFFFFECKISPQPRTAFLVRKCFLTKSNQLSHFPFFFRWPNLGAAVGQLYNRSLIAIACPFIYLKVKGR